MVSGNMSAQYGVTNRRIWATFTTFLIAGLLAAVLAVVFGAGNEFLLVALSICVLILPAIYQYLSIDRELFSPMNLVFFNLFIGVFLQTLVLCFYNEFGKNSLYLDPAIDFEKIVVGLSAIGISIFFFVIGYSFNPGGVGLGAHRDNYARYEVTIADVTKKRIVVLAILFGVVSLVSVIYFFLAFDVLGDLSRYSVKRHSESGGRAGIARFGMKFSQIACVIVFAYHLSCKARGKRSGTLGLFVVLLALASVGPFVSSSRSALIYLLIGVFAVHHYTTGGWRIKEMRNAVILILVVLLSLGALRFVQQRSISFAEYEEEVGLVGSVGRIAASNNFLGVKKTASLIDMVPSNVPHTYGSTYFLWLIAPVPRAIWEEKPVVRIGGVLGSTVFGTRESNGIPPGFVGEAYLNFGWFGIPLAAILFGAMVRRFYESYGRKAYSHSRSLLIYSLLFPIVAFASVSGDFTGFVSRAGQTLIPLVIAFWIIGLRKNRSY